MVKLHVIERVCPFCLGLEHACDRILYSKWSNELSKRVEMCLLQLMFGGHEDDMTFGTIMLIKSILFGAKSKQMKSPAISHLFDIRRYIFVDIVS